MASPHDVLEVDPDADEEAIERAYRRRVKETHPDHGGSAREFRLVRAAYEALTSDDAPDDETDSSERSWEPPDDDSGSGTPRRPPERHRVEYLNYAVLDDYGWRMDDADLFGKASAAGLDPADHGRILVEPGESLLEAAENRGFSWPYACRGGACANCAVAVIEGELSLPVNHVLPPEMIDRGFRLSCVGAPIVDDTKVVYNVKHLPGLDELRLPPRPFTAARADD